MKLILALTIGFAACASLVAAPIDESTWWDSVTETLECTAEAEEGNAILRITLYKPDESKIKEIKDDAGDVTGYTFNGIKLPDGFWPGCALIKSFDIEWDGKKVTVPERFWSALPGFRLQKSSLDIGTLPAEQRYKASEFLSSLFNPRIYISADKGTLLVEWVRPEECDSRSTIRWIITRSGTVLRHRHTPPHEC